MSEPKKERALKDVEAEYHNLVYKAGTLQYQVNVLSADLNLVNDQIKELNFEAAKLKSEEKLKEQELKPELKLE